jgi:hypothetical protein
MSLDQGPVRRDAANGCAQAGNRRQDGRQGCREWTRTQQMDSQWQGVTHDEFHARMHGSAAGMPA